MNRNLTNWGLTYRAEDNKPQRKTWATVENDANQPLQSSNGHAATNGSSPNSSLVNEHAVPQPPTTANHQQTPPKDPDLRSPQEREHSLNHSTQQTPTSTTFPVSTSSHDLSKNNASLLLADDDAERTAEMEARRQALLMSQMKRKEKINSFKEDKKNELDERREEESRKQEVAEQRKLERELKRLVFIGFCKF